MADDIFGDRLVSLKILFKRVFLVVRIHVGDCVVQRTLFGVAFLKILLAFFAHLVGEMGPLEVVVTENLLCVQIK